MLDPGLAFGTGTHPTTGLCLDYLCQQDLAGARLLDFGCGSGILGIAALKLGASRVIAVDNDPQALTATMDNARRNKVSDRMQIITPEQTQQLPVDVVLANILASTLIALVETIGPLASGGGRLALSGILRDQVDEVSSCYQPYLDRISVETREDWALLHGTGTA